MKKILIIYCLFLFIAYTVTAQEVYIPVSKEQQALTDLIDLLEKDRSAVEKQLGKGKVSDLKSLIWIYYPDKGIRVLIGGNEKEMVVNLIILTWKKKKVGNKKMKFKAWKHKFSLDDLNKWYGQYQVKSDYQSTYKHPDFNIKFNCKGYSSYHDNEVEITPSPSYQKRPKSTPEQIASEKKAKKAYSSILAIAKANKTKNSDKLFKQAKANNKETSTFTAYMSMNDGKIIEGYQIYLYNNNKIWIVKDGENIGGYIDVKMFFDETGEDKMRRIRYYILKDGKKTPYEFAIIDTKRISNYPFILFLGEGDFFMKFRGK